jgi:antitoxin PrlF
MPESLLISPRGQITLPAAIRKHLGLTQGSSLLITEIDGEIRLRPAAVLPVDSYTDTQIAAWDQADSLSPEERHQILSRLLQKSPQ